MTPQDIAKYFLLRASDDGDLVSPLKMQKLVYYAYAWYLARTSDKLFDEQIEAWANGPVIPSLYQSLRVYGSGPIDSGFLGFQSQKDAGSFVSSLGKAEKVILDDVYEKYMTLTAFELVVLTHNEKPWSEARKGIEPSESSNTPIKDEHIVEQYKLVA